MRPAFFNNVWTACAAEGWCDALGGVECIRVYEEWCRCGGPDRLIDFIRQHANQMAATLPPITWKDAK